MCIHICIHIYIYVYYIYIYEYYIYMNIHNANFEFQKINQRLLPRCLFLHDWFSSPEYPGIVLYDSKDWCIFGLSLLGQHCLYCGVLDGRWTDSNVGSEKRYFWWERDAMFSSKGRVRRLINVKIPVWEMICKVSWTATCWHTLSTVSVCIISRDLFTWPILCVWKIWNYELISWKPKLFSIYGFFCMGLLTLR